MSSIASLGRMQSALQASQKGLQVTGHNIANANTQGYTRQQLLLHDSGYINIGSAGSRQQVGMGVSLTEIRQIRNELADQRFRTESSIMNFYAVKQEATTEIESLFGEPHGESVSGMLEDFWKQAQKLATNPSGVEERLSFLQTAHVMIEKANYIMDGLTNYQNQINEQVIQSVETINTILHQIKDYNEAIVSKEINGDNANDLRDQRNMLLDELSQYIDIEYYEDNTGRVVVKSEGRTMVDNMFVTELDLKQTVPGSPFVKPVWKDTGDDLYPLNKEVNSGKENDTGRLKALLIIRGDDIVDANTSWDDIALNDNKSVSVSGNAFIIPKIQKEFSMFISEIAKEVNNCLDGMGMGEYEGMVGSPVFVPAKSVDGTPLPAYPNIEDYGDDIEAYNQDMLEYYQAIEKHLIPGNIKVNPDLLADGGYNKLGTVTEVGNVGDSSKVTELLEKWSEAREWPAGGGTGAATEPYGQQNSFMDFYAEFVADIGREGYDAEQKVKEKNALVASIENERLSIGGVSQDEELSNMIKYQYAYNAAARMVSILDGMMDTIINTM